MMVNSSRAASVGAFAMSHGGAPKDGTKMEEKKMDCSKTDKMDDKAKMECKKMEPKAESKAEPKK